jgi:hypothetical protein
MYAKYFLFKYSFSFSSSALNSTPPVQTIDSSQSYLSQSQQQQMTNSNLNDYSSPSSTLQNRYPIQPSNNPRARTTTNLNGLKEILLCIN